MRLVSGLCTYIYTKKKKMLIIWNQGKENLGKERYLQVSAFSIPLRASTLYQLELFLALSNRKLSVSSLRILVSLFHRIQTKENEFWLWFSDS